MFVFCQAQLFIFEVAMPVVGVASKLRQPGGGSKPIHTAIPIPSLGRAAVSQPHLQRTLEMRGTDNSMMSCQLSLKSICDFREKKEPQGKTKEAEDSKVCKKCKLHLVELCL